MKYKVGTIIISNHTNQIYKVVEIIDNSMYRLHLLSSRNIWGDSVFKWNDEDISEWAVLPPVLQELYDF